MSTPHTLNQYPWWKYLLIGLVLLWGLIFALPNLFGEDPAVQISGARANIAIDAAFQSRVAALLDTDKLPHKRLELESDRLLIRFSDSEEQLKAADILKDRLGRDYIVALNLASSAPSFLRAMGLNPMYLGLDLRGGVHFLMQVDMDATVKQVEDSYVDEIRTQLRNEKVQYSSVGRVATGGVQVEFKDGAERDKAAQLLRKSLSNLQQDEAGPLSLKLTLGEREIKEKRDFALQQNITTLRNRVNELGVAEPIIQQQGSDRIVVQLPGVQDTARAKEILGATATLEFRLADEENDWNQAAATGRVPLNSRLYKDRQGRPVLLQKRVMLTGDSIVDASSGSTPKMAGHGVRHLDGKGAKRMEDATKDNIGKRMGVVFIENKTETKRVDGELKKSAYTVEEVINVATIRDRLGRRFQITGLDSTREARDLALLLRAGALVSPIEIIEERTVGPSAGKENIAQGFRAAFIAFLVIGAFMTWRYKTVRLDRQCRAGRQRGADHRRAVHAASHPHAARHRRHRADHGHGGGRQRADLRAHPRRVAQRQQSASGDSRRLRSGFRHHPRLQHDHPDRGDHAVRLRHRPDQGLRGHAQHRHPDLDVHGGHRLAGAGQPHLWRPQAAKAVGLSADGNGYVAI
jgi:preprotein translocase subunit SecD